MVTTHVHIEPQPESQRVQRDNDTGNERIGLNPARKASAAMVSQDSYRPLVHIWALVRGDKILAAVSKPVLAFHDWISDPPMTERDRIKHYIVETRKVSKRRRLAGR